MAGTKIINNIYDYDDSFEPETISKEYLEVGYLSIEFTNMGFTFEKKLKADSVVEFNGDVYVFDIAPGGDEDIEGSLPSDGFAYARFYEDTGVAKIEWTTDALPDFDYERKGYYASDKRFVLKVKMYDDIMITEELLLDSYIVEQLAWENRFDMGDVLTRSSNWSLNWNDIARLQNVGEIKYVDLIGKLVSTTYNSTTNIDKTYFSNDGITWTFQYNTPDYVSNQIGQSNDSVSCTGNVELNYDSVSITSPDYTNWTLSPPKAVCQDQEDYSYKSVTADELLGWSAAWCLGTGCQGAPGYNSSQGRVMFDEYNYDTYFYASDAAANDEYGYSIATIVDADPGTADELFLIGAPGNNAAYQVFYDNSAIIVEQAILTPPSADPDDRFGHSVGFNEAYKVIGAPGANKAYVFFNNVYQATLSGTDDFGTSVGIYGDYVIVGSTVDAEVFLRSGTSWNSQQVISYGCSAVSIYGSKVIIGDSDNGEVKLYSRSGTTWSLDNTITESGDYGHAVALVNEIYVIGNPSLDRAYIYRISDDFLMQVFSPRQDGKYAPYNSGITGVRFGHGLGVFNYDYSTSDNYTIAIGDPDYDGKGRAEYFIYNPGPDDVGNVYTITPTAWNEDLEEFYSVCAVGDGSSNNNGTFFVTSKNGLDWTVKNRVMYIDNDNPVGMLLMWNTREQKYFAYSRAANGGFTWESTEDGYRWDIMGQTTNMDYYIWIGFAPELGIYYSLGKESISAADYYHFQVSADGVVWTTTQTVLSATEMSLNKVLWIKELHMFIVSASRTEPVNNDYNFMYSHDGYNWTYVKGVGADFNICSATDITYIPTTGQNPGMIVIEGGVSGATDPEHYRTLINK